MRFPVNDIAGKSTSYTGPAVLPGKPLEVPASPDIIDAIGPAYGLYGL